MRNHKKIAYEEILLDRKFKFYKRLSTGIGMLFIGTIIAISIFK